MQLLGIPLTLWIAVALGYAVLATRALTGRRKKSDERVGPSREIVGLFTSSVAYFVTAVAHGGWVLYFLANNGWKVPKQPGLFFGGASALSLANLGALVGMVLYARGHREKAGRDGTGRLAWGAIEVIVAAVILSPVFAGIGFSNALPLARHPWIGVVAFVTFVVLLLALVVAYWVVVWAVWRSPGGWIVGRSAFVLLGTIAVASGVAFLVLVRIANHLPVTHGSHVVMKDEITRACALLTGVVFLVLVLAAMLPLLLNAMERSGFARFVGARHVRATKSGFLTIISVLSIFGVAVSSCALGSVISIMGGFGQDLKRKILANNAHVVIDTTNPAGFDEWQPVLDRVRAVPGVTAATPMITGEVMASIGSNMSGVILRGIDVDTVGGVLDLPKNIEPGLGKLEWLNDPETVAALPWSERKGVEGDDELYLLGEPKRKNDVELGIKHEAPDPAVEKAAAHPIVPPDRPIYPTIIIGRELAKTLHLRIGSELSLVSRMGELTPAGVIPRERKFRVAAIFFSGMYEYDVSHAYISLSAARDFFDMKEAINAIQVHVQDAEKADLVQPAIVDAVGRTDLRVRDWREINKNLFSALKLERIATFIVLSLAIIVASFCILCTLLLMVTEKGREIAILKALGASDLSILRVFMVEGMIIGGIGTIFGVATGYAFCYGLSWFGVRIDPDVYYIDRLPIAVNAWDFAAVTAAALVICAISTLYPARAASKLLPVEGLRYE
jgi:lipoprotein-releasing system permease protein